MTRRTYKTATTLGLKTLETALAAPAAFAGQVNLSGLADGGTDQFIVRYKSGSAERADVARAQAAFGRMAAAGVGGKAIGLAHKRRLAIGADVIVADRKLDRVEAESLMRQIAADPNVEYVEVDAILKAALDVLIDEGAEAFTIRRIAAELGVRPLLVSDAHTCMDTPQLAATQIIAHHNATLAGPFVRLMSSDELCEALSHSLQPG